MAPLGQDYVEMLRRGCLEQRWVDRSRNRGKREGAYSSGSHGTHPFIMMSYQDDLFSLSTLAHELGHSMHSYHTRRTQPFIYGRYGLFLAEVASNFNQAMVRDYLFRTQTDRDFQIALIEEAMSNYHRYFFIMPTLAQFELEAHARAERGAPLSADILSGHHGRPVRGGLRRRGRDRPAAHRHHLGPVRPHVHELLRLPVRHRHLGRARAGPADPGRRRGRGRPLPGLPQVGRRRATRWRPCGWPAST